MCEWLSYGEWCDVKLLCGGRAFSAHRAVLASVSTFLRRLLLSCPTDESPTFIVLPDFDLDAMSSVLYYIYNGEVVVKKEKIKMFFDIINAMQIFIDNQNLPDISDKLEYKCFDFSYHNETNHSPRNIFTLGIKESEDQRYINVRKGKQIQDIILQYSVSNADGNDKLLRSQNPSGERKSPLGNLKSPYGDRQRNSFLRDLFIETYPRNGTVNGLTTGVLAISSECYRSPASVLLTNANGKHLSAGENLSEPYKKMYEHISHSPTVVHLRKQQRCTRDEPDHGESSKPLHTGRCLDVCSVEEINAKPCFGYDIKPVGQNAWLDYGLMLNNPLHTLGIQEKLMSGLYDPTLDFSNAPSMFDSVKSMHNYRNKLINDCNESSKVVDVTASNKVAILNHVLECPWTPRTPINYKPFRRKAAPLRQLQLSKQKVNEHSHNDSNNNVQGDNVSNNLGAVNHAILANDATEMAIVPHLPNIRGDDFKCTICNQVFITSDLLAVHMRRHSTNARYTCGECSKTFSQLRNFKYHMSIHRGTREFAATCTVCGKYFNDRGYLSSHMKIHRNRKEYKCTLCPKSFNQRVAYNMHVRIHTGVKPHVCEECGKAFSRKMLLKQHQRTHSGERPYACPHCDKRFADRSNMTLHLRLHTGVKPFSCTLCPKSFTKKHHLKSHLNFHTGSKPYSCPRCKLSFTQSSNMRTHLKKCRAPEPLAVETLQHNSTTVETTNTAM